MGTPSLKEASDIFNMSDEEISKMGSIPPDVEPKDPPQEEVKEPVAEETPTKEEPEPTQTETEVETETTTDNADTSKVDANSGNVPTKEVEQGNGSPKTDTAPAQGSDQKDPSKQASPGTESKSEEKAAPPNFEEFAQKVMAPFKANGKTIQANTPEEVIKLMQMGANYTRKMQELQPHKKMLLMLQTNGLLDEDKISYLIDLSQKNPEAIKKLVKESGIDPLEIDTEKEVAYRNNGNHRVTDAEVNFNTTLEELEATPVGKETIKSAGNWDQASKEELFKNPGILTVLAEHRELGVYAPIEAEIDRRRIIGDIPSTMPFLQAYKLVGDELANANKLPVKQAATQAAVVATRVATPKPAASNSSKASAASSTRSNTQKAKPFINYLEMDDKEFEKLKP